MALFNNPNCYTDYAASILYNLTVTNSSLFFVGSFGLSISSALIPAYMCITPVINNLMKGTEVPNPRRSSACDCTCVLTRNRSLSRDYPMLAMRIVFNGSCPCKVRSRVSDALSQALCNRYL